MVINLNEIQPLEYYLCQEAVDFFEKQGEKILEYEPKIEIFYCNGQPFKYYVTDGHHRLLACSRLGITEIPVESKFSDKKNHIERALEVHRKGIKSITDLESHLLPGFLCKVLSV